jgi:NAD(P)-dependent dehydrogenase (short-subunit alcohol dehydrogenase family)
MALDGKVILVTGAASGIGRAAVRRFLAAGARVAAVDSNRSGLESLADARELRICPCDVSDTRAVVSMIREVESELGGIDRAVNAAGILRTALLVEQDIDEVLHLMNVNYGGVVNISKAVLPAMLERGSGELVNIASLMGWVPSFHFGAYSATKFAVVAFTEVLRQENRHSGVRIACVCPPPVDTPMLGRLSTRSRVVASQRRIHPDEVVDAIEAGLRKGRLWIFPGISTSLLWRIRRFLPALFWYRLRKLEGFS